MQQHIYHVLGHISHLFLAWSVHRIHSRPARAYNQRIIPRCWSAYFLKSPRPVRPMFGSPQSLPSRTPSRTPSLLSLHQKNENQCKSSPKQSSTLDPLSSQLAGMGLHSPQPSPGTPSASFTPLSTVTSSPLKRTKGLVRHQNRSHVYETVVCITFFSSDRQLLTVASIKQKWKMINGRWAQPWLCERMRDRNDMVRSSCLTGTAPSIIYA